MDIEKPTLLITGSGGLIGQALCKRAAGQFKLITFDRKRPASPSADTSGYTVDLSAGEQVQRALREVRTRHGTRIASVVHLAAYYDFSGEPSPLYDEVTLRGTERLLCRLQDFEVEQFIYASTMLVHASCAPGERIDEDWPLQPKWAYPESKVKTEELVRAQRGDIPVVLLRIAGVYTDRCRLPTLAHQIQRIYERWLLSSVFPGDITHGQAAVHLDDVIDACLLLMQRRGALPPELPLLVGESDTVSYADLQRKLGLLIHGEPWDTHEIPKTLAKAGAWLDDALPLGEEPFIKPWMIDLADDHYALDTRRAHALLGWEARHTLRATLPRMIAALRADPLGWYAENGLTPPAWLTAGAVPPTPRRPAWGSAQPREQPR